MIVGQVTTNQEATIPSLRIGCSRRAASPSGSQAGISHSLGEQTRETPSTESLSLPARPPFPGPIKTDAD